MKPTSLFYVLMSLVFVAPAQAQSLGDRINHARNQQAKQSDDRIDKSSLRAMLGVLVYQDLTVNYQDSPAREVFKHLATELEINIIGRYNDDRRSPGFGIDPDAFITLTAEDMPALVVLELVLEQCGNHEPATWQFRNGFVEVGTLDRLSVPAARIVRVYQIDDMLFDPPRFIDAPSLDLVDAYRNGHTPYGLGAGYGSRSGGSFFPGSSGSLSRSEKKEQKAQQLIEYITQTVEPQAWTNAGGEYASIKYFDGALIIRAPDFIHRQIGGYPRPLKPQKEATETQEKPEEENP